MIISVALFLLLLFSDRVYAGNFEFVMPQSPYLGIFLASVLVSLCILLFITIYLLKNIFSSRQVGLQSDIKREIEDKYVAKMRSDYKKKLDEVNTRLQEVRHRFSLVMMKVKQLATTLDPGRLFNAVTDILDQELEAKSYIIFLHDPEKDELYPFRWQGYSDEIKDLLAIPMNHQHLLTHAFKKKQMLYRLTALEDPATKSLVDRNPINTTLVALSLSTQEKSFGVVHIESFKDDRIELDETDLRFFASISSFIGMAIANANVFLQTRKELTSTKQLNEQQIAEKRRIKEIFSRYTSSELVETLVKNPSAISLGGITKNATILFSDISGFTQFSSKLPPKEIVTVINEYLSAMTEVVLNHNGEIDKFIGDAVMARFGVLGDAGASGINATRAALAMLDELKNLHDKWKKQKRDVFSIRIGIATGPVLAGNIGSQRRQEFTVMGTTVNLASRLEALNKDLKTTILVDETTFQQVQHEMKAVVRENISIRGLSGVMKVYEIIGYHDSQQKSKIISFKDKMDSVKSATERGNSLSDRDSPGENDPGEADIPKS